MRGVEADEHVLADHFAASVALQDADEVKITRAMNDGPGVGLDQRQCRGELFQIRQPAGDASPAMAKARVRSIAEQAEAAIRCARQLGAVAVRGEVCVTEEYEVFIGSPSQEFDDFRSFCAGRDGQIGNGVVNF